MNKQQSVIKMATATWNTILLLAKIAVRITSSKEKKHCQMRRRWRKIKKEKTKEVRGGVKKKKKYENGVFVCGCHNLESLRLVDILQGSHLIGIMVQI